MGAHCTDQTGELFFDAYRIHTRTHSHTHTHKHHVPSLLTIRTLAEGGESIAPLSLVANTAENSSLNSTKLSSIIGTVIVCEVAEEEKVRV